MRFTREDNTGGKWEEGAEKIYKCHKYTANNEMDGSLTKQQGLPIPHLWQHTEMHRKPDYRHSEPQLRLPCWLGSEPLQVVMEHVVESRKVCRQVSETGTKARNS